MTIHGLTPPPTELPERVAPWDRPNPFAEAHSAILSEIWNVAVLAAARARQKATYWRNVYRVLADEDVASVDAMIAFNNWQREDAAWRQYIASVRAGIEMRTRDEMAVAKSRVNRGNARFFESFVCECERPGLVHIATVNATYCPLDGRPYWQMARLLKARDNRGEGCK